MITPAIVTVELPVHLRRLAGEESPVTLPVPGGDGVPPTIGALLDALEARFPALRGTLRDHATRRRRPFVRFYAVGEDLSHDPEDTPLPPAVAEGAEPFLIVGAMAGG